MKTASILFGLGIAACVTEPREPKYPLCDRDGAPACGNIGQVGRARPVQARPVQVLLGASAQSAAPVQRPLVDQRQDVVCGNVMGKGGPQRVCRDAGAK